ncbi:MAG: N-acetylmuramoyl-L-alanine amidase [Deltaproteobacteria bacterium]|nr:N-acetylmuramoyl-L-alanine amidase [Deltaproteobacteria bacterium]
MAKLYKMTLIVLILIALAQVTVAQEVDLQQLYDKATRELAAVQNLPASSQTRVRWSNCIQIFQEVFKGNPEGPNAPNALYALGKIYDTLFRIDRKDADFVMATDYYRRVTKRYPGKSVAAEAQYRLGLLYLYKGDYKQAYAELGRVQRQFPQGDLAIPASKKMAELSGYLSGDKAGFHNTGGTISSEPHDPILKAGTGADFREAADSGGAMGRSSGRVSGGEDAVPAGGQAAVTAIRHWSNKNYTRIAINLNRPVPYSKHNIKQDPENKKPERIYIDLEGASLSKRLSEPISINDGLLLYARAGQFTPEKVRLVLDIASIQNYKVFTLDNPFGIVIDVWGKQSAPTEEPPKNVVTSSHKGFKERSKARKRVPRGKATAADDPESCLAQQLGLKVKKIVIDPGHGGKDPGAIGYDSSVQEKDITLKIAKKLAGMVRQKLACEVVLTRSDDRFIPLEERTAIANTQSGDLFVSIHANASPNESQRGVETYFLNLATDKEAVRVAARENATTTKKISDMHTLLNDLMLNSKINESNRLGRHVQHALVRGLKKKYSNVNDLGVKQAPFYVLIGAEMPSILIETSFISNQEECRRMKDDRYLEQLAESILKGLETYVKGAEMAAIQ